MLLAVTISYSQILINETFDGATLPADWFNFPDFGEGTQVWTFGSGEVPGNDVENDFTSNAAIFDDDAAGPGGSNDRAILGFGPLDVSALSNLILTYQYAFNVSNNGPETLTVEIWDNLNFDYITLATYNTDINPTNGVIDISEVIDNNPGIDPNLLYIAFQYNDIDGGWGWGAGIDNVRFGVQVENDWCIFAIDVPVNAAGTGCTSPTVASNALASDSSLANGTPTCGNFDGGDIWFSFVAPPTGDIKIIVPVVGEWSSFSTAIYDGPDCTDVELACEVVFDINLPGEIPAEAIYTGLTPGNSYYLRAWDFNNNDFGDVSFCIEEFDSTASIGEDVIDGLTLYPNPIEDVLKINAQEEITKLSIYNQIGQEVKIVNPLTSNFTVDLSTLAAGVYIVKIETNDKISSKRLIKK